MNVATDCTGRDVVAIDPSLRSTGVASPSSDGELEVVTIDSSGAVGWRRTLLIAEFILRRVGSLADPLVLMEGYSFGSRNSQAHAAGELGGVILCELGRRGVEVCRVPPTKLKKFATGKGNASKALVVSSVAARTGWVFANDDLADALALWCFGRAHLKEPHPMDPLPKINLEALEGFAVEGQTQ